MSEENNPPAGGEDVSELQAQIAQLNATNERLKGDLGKSSRLLKKFEGINLEDLQAQAEAAKKFEGINDDILGQAKQLAEAAQSDEHKRILQERGIEGLVEHRISAYTEETERKLRAVAEERDNAKAEREKIIAEMRDKDFSLAVSAAVSKFGRFEANVDRYVASDLRGMVRYKEDGSIQLVEDGETILSVEDPTKDMSIEEYVAKNAEKIWSSLLRRSEGVRAKGSGEPSRDNPFMDRTRATEQRKIRNEDPSLAKRLAQAAREAGKGKEIKAANV